MESLISIIVPVYNQEKYIGECINSLLNQSYANYEIVIVNDGSTDRSLEICLGYEVDNRIRIYNQRNQGVSVARNEGLKHANGKWIAFVDPDDFVELDYLQKLIECTDDKTDIVISGCIVVDGNDRVHESFFEKDFESISVDEKRILYKQLLDASYGQPGKAYTACGVPWGKLYRHSLLLDNSLLFEPQLLRMQDNIFNMYAFKYARKIKYCDLHLYYYRVCHVTNFVKNYNPMLDKILYEVRKYRYIFFSEFFMDDTEIRDFYNKEAYELIKWYFNGYLYNDANKMKKKEKIDAILDMLSRKEFGESIRSIRYNQMHRKKEKLYLFAMCNRLGWMINVLASVEHKLYGVIE